MIEPAPHVYSMHTYVAPHVCNLAIAAAQTATAFDTATIPHLSMGHDTASSDPASPARGPKSELVNLDASPLRRERSALHSATRFEP